MAGYIGKGQPLVSNGAERKFKYVATAGQTVFNATYSVGSVHVYRTGVRLTDGVDYTATDGATVTLATGCNAGDDVVIVGASGFQVADAYTKAELANHDLVTVDASGNVQTNYLGIRGNLWNPDRADSTYPTIRFNDSSTASDTNGDTIISGYYPIIFKTDMGHERMRIDRDGRVTMPYQPAFRCGNSIDSSGTGYDNILFQNTTGNTFFNRGGHFSPTTGRFTAPVSGAYYFHFQLLWENLAEGQRMDDGGLLYVNGILAAYDHRRAEYVAGTTGNSGYYGTNCSTLLELNAGDYVEVKNMRAGLVVHQNDKFSFFTGHLIG